jgi:hypothetical protein
MSRLITTVVLTLVVVGIVLAATGVLRFHNTEDQSGITIDKKELKEKAQDAVENTGEAGSAILNKTGEILHKAVERMRGSSDDQSSTTTSPAANDENTGQPAENPNAS